MQVIWTWHYATQSYIYVFQRDSLSFSIFYQSTAISTKKVTFTNEKSYCLTSSLLVRVIMLYDTTMVRLCGGAVDFPLSPLALQRVTSTINTSQCCYLLQLLGALSNSNTEKLTVPHGAALFGSRLRGIEFGYYGTRDRTS